MASENSGDVVCMSSGGDTVLEGPNFSQSRLKFKPPKRNAQGGYTVYTYYDGLPYPGTVFVQAPPLRLPFGVSSNINDNADQAPRYSAEGSLDDKDSNVEMRNFVEFLNRYDDAIVEGASVNCQKWFGKSIPKEAIEQLVRRNVRPSKNSDYSDTVRMRLTFTGGKFAAPLYDLNEKEISWDRVKSNTVIIPMLAAKSIWFVNKMFGVTWEIDHAVLVKEGGRTGFTKCAIRIPQSLSVANVEVENAEDETFTVENVVDETSESAAAAVSS